MAEEFLLVRVGGVEPPSQPWEGCIMAVIRHPLVRVCSAASFCLLGKSFGLCLCSSSQNSIQSTSLLGLEFCSGLWPPMHLLQRRIHFGFVSLYWSHLPGSNWRPTRYECVALPTELRWPIFPCMCLSDIIIPDTTTLQTP